MVIWKSKGCNSSVEINVVFACLMLQKARKIGRFPPSGRRICRKSRPLSQIQLSPTVDSQPFDFQMTIFSYLLQQKIAPIFRIKRPLLEQNKRRYLPREKIIIYNPGRSGRAGLNNLSRVVDIWCTWVEVAKRGCFLKKGRVVHFFVVVENVQFFKKFFRFNGYIRRSE